MSQKLALIIASYEYEDPDFRRLVAPPQDAEELARVLKDPAIGGFDEVATLLNQPSYKVNREIEVFFADRKLADLLLLYFSGHGIKDLEGRLYFATTDTRRKTLRTTAIPATLVNDVMRYSRSRQQVLLLDCCYSGAFPKDAIAKADKAIGTGEQFEARGRVVLTASDAMQYAFEGDEVSGTGVQSIFTRSLVHGLKTGEADLDSDGLVTLDELYRYVYDRVVDERPEQRPEKSGFVQGEIVIARSPIVRPAQLPLELRQSIKDPRPWVREGVAHELERLLRGSHIGLALAAHEALKRLADDDSRRVSTAAAQSLEAYAEAQRLKEREREQQERQAREAAEAERRAREKAERERLAREKAEAERRRQEELEAQRRHEKEEAQTQLRCADLYAQGVQHHQASRWTEALEAFRTLEGLAGDYKDIQNLMATAERERLAQEEAEAERLAAQRAEEERVKHEKAEHERLARRKAEAEHLAALYAQIQQLLSAEKWAEAIERYTELLATAQEVLVLKEEEMEDLTGKQLGPYQVVAPQGEGGMAAVYKAYQPGMDRYVALKILPRHLASDPEYVGRFEQEAKVIAKLQHPHILPVFDYGEADGYTYLVMPFVETGTLAGLLQDQPLPLQHIRRIVSQLGDALNYAHSRGLLHRDVKPSNVLIDESGNCLLSDFGIAKIVEGTAKFTATGGVLGTPAYMSPEQGKGLKADRRSDIYSLGVILYEMATGRVPFRAETPIAVVIKHINDPLPLPRTLNPTLPEAVERVILKSLAKQPDDRFVSAAEMVKALQAAIPESLVETVQVGATTPVSPPTVEQDLGRAATVAAPAEKPQAGVRAALSTAASKLRPERLRRIPAWGWVLGGLVILGVAAGLLARGGALVIPIATVTAPSTQPPPPDPRATAQAHFDAGADYLWNQRNFEAAIDEFNQAIELEPDWAESYHLRGIAYREKGDLEAALADHNRAIELNPDGPYFYHERALTYRVMDDLEAAIADHNRAIELNPDDPNLYSERAVTYRVMGDLEAALADHDRAIELNPDEPYFYFERGATYRDSGNLEAAIADLSQAIQLRSDDPYWFFLRAVTYRDMGDLEAALADHDRAIELAPDKPEYYFERAWTYREAQYRQVAIEIPSGFPNALEAAIADFSRAIELGPSSGTYGERGVTYRDMGNLEAALADLNQAISLDPGSANYYIQRAITYRESGNLEAALADHNRAIELAPDSSGYYFERAWTYREAHRRQVFSENLPSSQAVLEAAIADFSQAIQLRSDDPYWFFERAWTYRDSGNLEAAIADWSRAIELNPNEPGFYHERAYTYRDSGNLEAALADHNRAIELEPGIAGYYHERGFTYALKGDLEAAIADYSQAIELNPEAPSPYWDRAGAYRDMNQVDSAVRDYQSFLERVPPDECPECQEEARSYIASNK